MNIEMAVFDFMNIEMAVFDLSAVDCAVSRNVIQLLTCVLVICV